MSSEITQMSNGSDRKPGRVLVVAMLTLATLIGAALLLPRLQSANHPAAISTAAEWKQS